MINQSTRDELRAQIRKGDYETAAKIYKNVVNRYVTARYLEKFLKGQKNPTGRTGCHDPSEMFEAIAQAVSQRHQREREATDKADALVKAIMRDTKPQPIAL